VDQNSDDNASRLHVLDFKPAGVSVEGGREISDNRRAQSLFVGVRAAESIVVLV
jgi:hypothetical protein